jgi:hypothetical protein
MAGISRLGALGRRGLKQMQTERPGMEEYKTQRPPLTDLGTPINCVWEEER